MSKHAISTKLMNQINFEIEVGFKAQERGYDPNPYIQRIRQIPAGIIEAYLETIYHIELDDFSDKLKIGQHSYRLDTFLQFHNHTTWTIITAYNPNSIKLPKEENENRNAELARTLTTKGLKYYQATGISKDGNWSEPSFFIPDIDFEYAELLGYTYDQNAIVFGEVGYKAEIIFC
jgi:hypothetical protein